MSDLAERGRRKRREQNLNWTEQDEEAWLRDHPEDRPAGWVDPTTITHDQDLIPEIEVNERVDDELQPHLDRIGILEAFERWGKPQEGGIKVGSKRESIMVRCPDPGHVDADPSASINLDKDVYACHRCETGGDKFDVFAYSKGYAVPGYKHDGSFPEMRRKMAEEFGIVITRTPGGTPVVKPPVEVDVPITEEDPAESPAGGIDESGLAPVVPISPEVAEAAEVADALRIDWEGMFHPETYMYEVMSAVTIDDLPHEYYFWLALQSLATAVGANVYMDDFLPIKPNLYVVLYGRTGAGKSRSTHPIFEIVRDVLPFTADPHTETTGTMVLPSPGSAEALIDSFNHQILDPSTMAPVKSMPVRGLLKVEEFASFAARAARHGNPMKETLIELYDVFHGDVTHKTRSGGLVKARDPFAQVITTTQPKAIHNFLRRTDADSGFMNRFVFAVGTRRRERIAYGGVSFDLTASKAMLKGVHTWANAGPHRYELSGAALGVWSDFFIENIVPLQEGSDESMYSRIDLTMKKLMILFAANDKALNIEVHHVDMAISLFNYLRTTYFMFSTDLAHTEDEECASKIVAIVESVNEKSGKPCTRRELLRRLNNKFAMTTVVGALKLLEQVDVITFQTHKNAKGPATQGYVVEK